jgi:hypothetical protein
VPLVLLALIAALVGQTACRPDVRLPSGFTDEEFWRLSNSLSEPPGGFSHSENLVSNEMDFVHTIGTLHPGGGAYIGVGPEQNFSYIARLRPDLAFIIDIRRENRNLHLMYKALFEASTDRADFVSRLFSLERPAELTAGTPVAELFAKYAAARRSDRLRDANARLIHERLVSTHGFPLETVDLESIDYVFDAFYSDGINIHYARSRPASDPGPSYRVLMSAADILGQSRSYLASEEAFQFLKRLHERNLIVPLVGDFAGPRAIRMAGDYIRAHGASVRAFYGSNVEVYLNREQSAAFCANLAALPQDYRTWFIGSKAVRMMSSKLRACSPESRSNQVNPKT